VGYQEKTFRSVEGVVHLCIVSYKVKMYTCRPIFWLDEHSRGVGWGTTGSLRAGTIWKVNVYFPKQQLHFVLLVDHVRTDSQAVVSERKSLNKLSQRLRKPDRRLGDSHRIRNPCSAQNRL
jgi:hypothetical protein